MSAFERNGLAEPLGLFESFERLESHEPISPSEAFEKLEDLALINCVEFAEDCKSSAFSLSVLNGCQRHLSNPLTRLPSRLNRQQGQGIALQTPSARVPPRKTH